MNEEPDRISLEILVWHHLEGLRNYLIRDRQTEYRTTAEVMYKDMLDQAETAHLNVKPYTEWFARYIKGEIQIGGMR